MVKHLRWSSVTLLVKTLYLLMHGTLFCRRSKSSIVIGMSSIREMASVCRAALVEPPMAEMYLMPFSKLAFVMTSRKLTPSLTS